MNKAFYWKVYWILVAAAAFGLVAIVPYALAPQAEALKNTHTPIPLPLVIALQIGVQVIAFAVMIAIGLFFANRTGLGLPIVEAKLRGEPVGARLRAVLPISVILGVVGAFIIVGLDEVVFQPALKAELANSVSKLPGLAANRAAWQGFLASFYGGIDEELLLRLLVMSLLAWLGHFISRKPDGTPTVAVFWIANVLAAVLFGLGHLPATAQLVPITPLVVVRAVVLNGLVGIACGYLYFTRGLESAMISHFSADIILHVLFAI
jgi:membrane protease YdiL (CAAX protease family)